MINIFAREITDDLAGLVKQVDDVVTKNADKKNDKKPAAFLVVLTKDPDAVAVQLEALAEKHGIKNVPLTLYKGDAGPREYKIAKDADVTVLMWRERDVKVNYALKKGQLDAATTKKIIADTETILK